MANWKNGRVVVHHLGLILIPPPPAVDYQTEEGRMLAAMTGAPDLKDYAYEQAGLVLDEMVELGATDYDDPSYRFDTYELPSDFCMDTLGDWLFTPQTFPMLKVAPTALVIPQVEWMDRPVNLTPIQRVRAVRNWRTRARRRFRKYPDHLLVTFTFNR